MTLPNWPPMHPLLVRFDDEDDDDETDDNNDDKEHHPLSPRSISPSTLSKPSSPKHSCRPLLSTEPLSKHPTINQTYLLYQDD